jgi:ribosomal protein S18 acetylase RimI-like enzyme
MTIETIRADYGNVAHAQSVIDLLDAYARDAMGGATPLGSNVRDNIIPALAAMPTAFSVLAFVDGVAAGLANCFEGFSTFACKPLINIHDVVTHPDYRGQGVGRALMAEVEAIAREKDCCKITLEVLTGNGPAMQLYRDLGYGDYVLGETHGTAVFWQKKL